MQEIQSTYGAERASDNARLASEMRIFGTMHFPPKHTTANISDILLNARIDFDVLPKNVEDRFTQSEEALRGDKLGHFATEPPLDRSVLTSDCESDVSARAEKDHLLYRNRGAYPCLRMAVHAAMKSNVIEKFLYRLYSQSHYRKSMGLVGSSLEHEVQHTEKDTRVEAEGEWWTTSIRPKKGEKASTQQSASSVKANKEIILRNWLTRQKCNKEKGGL